MMSLLVVVWTAYTSTTTIIAGPVLVRRLSPDIASCLFMVPLGPAAQARHMILSMHGDELCRCGQISFKWFGMVRVGYYIQTIGVNR